MPQRVPIDLVLHDGTEHQVIVDQRDFAAAEAKDLFAHSPQVTTRTRFMAWNAAKRAGLTKVTWEKWNATECESAEVSADHQEEPAGADELDPGRKGQSGDA
jgi:hypothetical protein